MANAFPTPVGLREKIKIWFFFICLLAVSIAGTYLCAREFSNTKVEPTLNIIIGVVLFFEGCVIIYERSKKDDPTFSLIHSSAPVATISMAYIGIMFSIYSEVFLSQGSLITPMYRAVYEDNKSELQYTAASTKPKGAVYLLDISKSMCKQVLKKPTSQYYLVLDKLNSIADNNGFHNKTRCSNSIRSLQSSLGTAETQAKLQLIDEMLRSVVEEQDTGYWYMTYAFDGVSYQIDSLTTPTRAHIIHSVESVLICDTVRTGNTDFLSLLKNVHADLIKWHKSGINTKFSMQDMNVFIFSDFEHDNYMKEDGVYKDSIEIAHILRQLRLHHIRWIAKPVFSKSANLLTTNVATSLYASSSKLNVCTSNDCDTVEYSNWDSREPIIFYYSSSIYSSDARILTSLKGFDKETIVMQLFASGEYDYDDRQEYFYVADSIAEGPLLLGNVTDNLSNVRNLEFGFRGHICTSFPHLELQIINKSKCMKTNFEIVFQKALPRPAAHGIIIATGIVVGCTIWAMGTIIPFIYKRQS